MDKERREKFIKTAEGLRYIMAKMEGYKKQAKDKGVDVANRIGSRNSLYEEEDKFDKIRKEIKNW